MWFTERERDTSTKFCTCNIWRGQANYSFAKGEIGSCILSYIGRKSRECELESHMVFGKKEGRNRVSHWEAPEETNLFAAHGESHGGPTRKTNHMHAHGAPSPVPQDNA